LSSALHDVLNVSVIINYYHYIIIIIIKAPSLVHPDGDLIIYHPPDLHEIDGFLGIAQRSDRPVQSGG